MRVPHVREANVGNSHAPYEARQPASSSDGGGAMGRWQDGSIARLLFRTDLLSCRSIRQLIASVIVLVVGMPLHPLPGDLVAPARCIEFHPQILVQHRAA